MLPSISEMQGMNHVEFIQGDFSDEQILRQVEAALGGAKVDLVMSDMLPNMTGVTAIDSPRAIYLCELAAELFPGPSGSPTASSLTKAYQGPGYQEFFQQLKQQFKTVVSRNPTHPGIAVQRYTFGQWFAVEVSARIRCSIFFAETTLHRACIQISCKVDNLPIDG